MAPKQLFDGPPPDTEDHVVRQYAKAYMLALVGSVLFLDKSGTDIRLFVLSLLRDLVGTNTISWGSTVLSYLYHELCRAARSTSNQIAGPLILLQVCAIE